MGLVEVWRGTYVTAKNACNYIDAENIINDANKIKKQLDEIDDLVRNVKNAGSGLTRDVLLVDDKDMSGTVDESTLYITNTKSTQVGYLDEIIQRATTLYNDKQNEYNTQAQAEDRRIRAQKNKSTSG